MPQNLSDRFADSLTAHTIDLDRYAASESRRIAKMLENLSGELTAELARIDPTAPSRNTYKIARLQTLLESANGTIDEYYGEITTSHLKEMRDLASMENEFTSTMFSDVIQGSVFEVGLHPAIVRTLARDTLIMGAPSKEWWAGQRQSLKHRFTTEIRNGMLRGESMQEMARRVRGSPRHPGIMNVTRRNATALVRSSVQAVANAARFTTYEENADVIKELQAIVTLDGRTTPICIARSGHAWDVLTKEQTRGGSADPWPGPPPWHWQCRSTLVPITKTWEELGAKKAFAEVPPSTQSSMDGQVAADLNYEQWLDTKDEKFQKEVLGPKRWEMWKEDKLNLGELIDQSGRPLTLPELQQKIEDGTAFGRVDAMPVDEETGIRLGSAKWEIFVLWRQGKSVEEIIAALQGKAAAGTVKTQTSIFKKKFAHLKTPGVKPPIPPRPVVTPPPTVNPIPVAPPPVKPKVVVANVDEILEDLAVGARRGKITSGAEVRKMLVESKTKLFSAANALAKEKKAIAAKSFEAYKKGDNVLYARLREQERVLKGKIQQANSFAKKRVHDLIAIDDPMSVKISLAGKGKKTAAVIEAEQFLSKIVSKELGRTSIRVDLMFANGRPFAKTATKKIFVSSSAEAKSFVHEVGHILEENTLMKKKVEKFFEARIATDKRGPQKLAELLGEPAYGDEIAVEDKFYHPYIGKIYKTGKTEVVSMGLEYLYDRPYQLMEYDPEFFDFLIDLLRGL